MISTAKRNWNVDRKVWDVSEMRDVGVLAKNTAVNTYTPYVLLGILQG